MRVSLAGGPDLELSESATVNDVRAWVAAHQHRGGELWVGTTRLAGDHRAGVAPLTPGAVIGDAPADPTAPVVGPRLAVVAGPDCGALVPVRGDVTIGRSVTDATLYLHDRALSGRHLTVAGSPPTVVDHRSTNGTVLERDGRRRRVWRTTPLRAGDFLWIGDSVIEYRDDARAPTRADGEGTSPARGSARVAGTAGSVAMGLALGIATGRWYLAAIALAVPAVTYALPWWRARRGHAACPTLPNASGDAAAERADVAGPVAIVGSGDAAAGLARAIALDWDRGAVADDERWSRWLRAADGEHHIVVVDQRSDVPSWCATICSITKDGVSVESAEATWRWPGIAVSARSADAAARRVCGARGGHALPDLVTWGDVRAAAQTALAPSHGEPRRLIAHLGVGDNGPVTLDLDRDGPHVLVAGTTGAGKSALLECLVLGLAHDHSPAHLTVAVADFKGGAGLASCRNLPHTAGVVTDLDGDLADRVLAALAAELVDRKRRCAVAGHASIHAWERVGGAPPRLLVVMDEYQEVTALRPDFLPEVARLAAQGRSLGLHLVLATQRPAGAVTPQVRANVGVTVALRVTSEAESRDLIGTGDAAELPPITPGRGLVARGQQIQRVQVAVPDTHVTPAVRRADEALPDVGDSARMAAAVCHRWSQEPGARPLWLPPLPSRYIAEPPNQPGVVTVALADEPGERVQPPVTWDPRRGPLVVAGPAQSGRTALLHALAAQASLADLNAVWLPADARRAARTLYLTRSEPRTLLLVDDADRTMAALADVDRGDAAAMLADRCRQPWPTALVFGPGPPGRLAAHASVRAVVAGMDVADAGAWGVPRHMNLGLTPGRAAVSDRGSWREAQLAWHEAGHRTERVSPLPLDRGVGGAAPPPPAIGVGGDDARLIDLPPGARVIVVGPAGPERENCVAIATRAGSTVVTAESGLAVPGGIDVNRPVLIVQPTPRALRELGIDEPGLVDPSPVPGRVVARVGGRAMAVDLAQVDSA